MNNTLILCFVLGWQGGSVHQVARELECSVNDILDANDEQLGTLCRKAQLKNQKTLQLARLLIECRDALPAITDVSARLYSVDLSLADRIEDALSPWEIK